MTDQRPAAPSAHPRDVGVRLIVLYKAVKAVAEVALAVALVVLAATGEMDRFREAARALRMHLASRWSLVAGRALAALVTERAVHLIEVGLALDGVVSAVEGWSLWRGFWWGPWVVVVATATPLPLELVHLAHAFRPTRLALVVINAAVVVYLARSILLRSRRPR